MILQLIDELGRLDANTQTLAVILIKRLECLFVAHGKSIILVIALIAAPEFQYGSVQVLHLKELQTDHHRPVRLTCNRMCGLV